MSIKYKFGSDEATRFFFDFFNAQLSLLERLYQHQFTNLKHLDDTCLGNLYFLLFSIHHTGTSISILSTYYHINECYILARSFLEKLINYTYLLSCDDEEYSKYLAYTKQKSYRILNRSFAVGDSKVSLTWSGSIDLDKDSELKKAIDMFTGKTGKHKTRWTSKNLSNMLESIEHNGKIDIVYLMCAILYIYDDASEALHGTLYGSLFHIGIYTGQKPSSENELKEAVNKSLLTLFLVLGCCVHTLLNAFHKVSDIENMLIESKRNLDEISRIRKQSIE
jgi:hypothetical protein